MNSKTGIPKLKSLSKQGVSPVVRENNESKQPKSALVQSLHKMIKKSKKIKTAVLSPKVAFFETDDKRNSVQDFGQRVGSNSILFKQSCRFRTCLPSTLKCQA